MAMTPMPISMSRTETASALSGQFFHLPDFDEICHGWPVSVSPHSKWLKKQVDNRIRWLLSQASSFLYKDPKHKQKELEAIDVSYLVSTWWPQALPEVLCTLAYCALWLFMWDDEIDGNNASLGSDLRAAQQYRETTLQYVVKRLGLVEGMRETAVSATTNILITSFSDVAKPLAAKGRKQRERFYREIECWVQSIEVEQVRRGKPSLPSLQEYMDIRIGTSGVRVLCILFDILTGPAFDSCHPTLLANDSGMTTAEDLELLTDLTNLFISITNDVFSVKKELAVDAPDSTIPILWLESRDLTVAVGKAVRMLKIAKSLFDETERRLIQVRGPHNGGNVKIERYVEALKTMSSGNIAWSMQSKRYGLRSLAGETRQVVNL